jgi:hypothetical protein
VPGTVAETGGSSIARPRRTSCAYADACVGIRCRHECLMDPEDALNIAKARKWPVEDGDYRSHRRVPPTK